jgi:hypothetical protein
MTGVEVSIPSSPGKRWPRTCLARIPSASACCAPAAPGSGKFEQKAFEHICSLDKLHHLVTAAAPPAKLAKALSQNGVAVHLPEKKNASS